MKFQGIFAFLVLVPFCSGFAQETDVDSTITTSTVFYRPSRIPREWIFTPYFGVGVNGFNMKKEEDRISRVESFNSDKKIDGFRPSWAIKGGIGIFNPNTSMRILFDFDYSEYTNKSLDYKETSPPYELSHEIYLYQISTEKIFENPAHRLTDWGTYFGVGGGFILAKDNRLSQLNYKFNSGPIQYLTNRFSSTAYLGVITVSFGSFSRKTSPMFAEIRGSWQYTFSSDVQAHSKPGFDPSDYSPELNALRLSILFGLVL